MLTESELVSWLKPGDVLCYKGLAVIRWKTWSDTGHVELYLGNGQSAAARREGVGTYPVAAKDVVVVLRPSDPFDIERMRAFHEKCVALPMKYDWWGLVRVFVLNKQGAEDRAFCSEHVARMCQARNGGPEMINARADADEVSPGDCEMSPHFVWWKPAEIAEDIRAQREARYVETDRRLVGPAGGAVGHPLGPA